MLAILLIMTTRLKSLVSKNKKRYQEGKYNLDLSYIQSNIIAMGYPAEKIEGIYRNNIEDVKKFFEEKHAGHYKIYNLCRERQYNIAQFNDNVSLYPFDDHNPPKIEKMKPFCKDVDEWLSADVNNVAAIHCKAGKGRTGVMITAYLLHKRIFESPKEALRFYGERRTHDHKGVTIPSQRRYVEYYGHLVTNNLDYRAKTILLKSLSISPIPTPTGGFNLRIVAYQRKSENECESPVKIFNSDLIELRKNHDSFLYTFDPPIPLTGDVKIELWNNPKLKKKEKLCSFWFNTFFAEPFKEEGETLSSSSNFSVYSTSTSSSASPECRSNSESSISHSSLEAPWNSTIPSTTTAITTTTNRYISESSNSNSRSAFLPSLSEFSLRSNSKSSAFLSSLLENSNNSKSDHHHRQQCANREGIRDRLAVFGTSTTVTGSKVLCKNGRSRFNSGPPPHTDTAIADGRIYSPDYYIILRKDEIDKANKDKTHKIFSPDFTIKMNFMKTSPSSKNFTRDFAEANSETSNYSNYHGIKMTGQILGGIGIGLCSPTGKDVVATDCGHCTDSETETEDTDEEWGGCSVDL